MCCFSPVTAPISLLARLFVAFRTPTVRVAGTSIFARMEPSGTQLLAYSMRLSVAGDVAMILPLPVVPGGGDDALSFINLEDHPRLFHDLEELFFPPMPAAARGGFKGLPAQSRPKLVVHDVGAFEASFVPTRRDFDRLDERFRLPDVVWEKLGDYHDFGFAVFRLKAGKKKQIHPMAFRFRTRDPARLFFPTVHVHDGHVHPTARFDHTLYYQPQKEPVPGDGLTFNLTLPTGDALSYMSAQKTYAGLLIAGNRVARRAMHGELPNRDTWIA